MRAVGSCSSIIHSGSKSLPRVFRHCVLAASHGGASAQGTVQQQQQQPKQPSQQQQQQLMATLREPRASLATIDDYRIISNIDASMVPEELKKDCILFYTPDTEPLARKIAKQGKHVSLGNIRWK